MSKPGAKKDEDATIVSIDTNQSTENGKDKEETKTGWIRGDDDFIMMLVTFIAAVAFQVGTNPPGSVWQEDNIKNNTIVYTAGKSIMASKSRPDYVKFMSAVSVCLTFSLIQLVVMLFRWYLKSWSVRRFIMYFMMITTLTGMVVAYWSSLRALTPEPVMKEITASFWTVLGSSMLGIPLVLLYYICKKCL